MNINYNMNGWFKVTLKLFTIHEGYNIYDNIIVHVCDFPSVDVETSTLLSSSFKKVNAVFSSGCGFASQRYDSNMCGAF